MEESGIVKQVVLHGKTFRLYIPHQRILNVIDSMAERMNVELAGKKPIFVCVLNGAFMFAAELFKRIKVEGAEITFVKMTSYHGVHSTGTIRQLIGLNEAIEGRTVIIIEDIVDSGLTIENISDQLAVLKPLELKIATLLFKPASMLKVVTLDYVGIEIPNDFIVGYGLDFDSLGRNLPDIYSIVP